MMVKYIIMLSITLWITACSAHNEQYYRSHPQALQHAIKNCSETSSRSLNCTQLDEIAFHVNQLAYQLRTDPQGYGKEILDLQQTIAKEENTLREEKTKQPELESLLLKNKQDLSARLAIVGWLAAPTS